MTHYTYVPLLTPSLLHKGLTLVAEAFMSAAYHICPSGANYQFGKGYWLIDWLVGWLVGWLVD